jgi:hypothetical protein
MVIPYAPATCRSQVSANADASATLRASCVREVGDRGEGLRPLTRTVLLASTLASARARRISPKIARARVSPVASRAAGTNSVSVGVGNAGATSEPKPGPETTQTTTSGSPPLKQPLLEEPAHKGHLAFRIEAIRKFLHGKDLPRRHELDGGEHSGRQPDLSTRKPEHTAVVGVVRLYGQVGASSDDRVDCQWIIAQTRPEQKERPRRPDRARIARSPGQVRAARGRTPAP